MARWTVIFFNVDEYREATRKLIETEVRNIKNEEMRKAIRQVVKEQRVVVREAVEEERKAIRTRLDELRKSVLELGLG